MPSRTSHSETLIRVSAATQLFEFKPDLAYVYTQDFFQLGKGLTLSTIAQVDFLPLVAEKLILVDVTYRTGPKARLRLSFHRHRSTLFDRNPIFQEVIGKPPIYVPNDQLEIPEPKSFTESTTYNQARVIGQLEVAPEITGFTKVGFRQRTVDGASGPVVEVGASAFSPIKYPVQGIVRYRYDGAFDATSHTISANVWRKLSFTSPTTFGGSVSYVLSKAKLDDVQNPKVAANYSVLVLSGFVRYDISKYAFFAEYEMAAPSGVAQGGPQNGDPIESSDKLEHLFILGFTMRFGQGAKRLF